MEFHDYGSLCVRDGPDYAHRGLLGIVETVDAYLITATNHAASFLGLPGGRLGSFAFSARRSSRVAIHIAHRHRE